MSNGYLVAAPADAAAAREIGYGFSLEVIETDTIGDPDATSAALASAANVGLLLSNAAAADERFVAFLQTLATHLQRAQLIIVDAEARAAFAFLPESWPVMPLADARARAAALAQQRQPETQTPPPAPTPEPPPVEPETHAEDPVTAAPPVEEDGAPEAVDPEAADPKAADEGELLGGLNEDAPTEEAPPIDERAITIEPLPEPEFEREESFGAGGEQSPADAAPEAPAAEPPAPPPQAAEPPPAPEPPRQVTEPEAPAPAAPPEAPPAPAPQTLDDERASPPRKRSTPGSAPVGASASSAPADATAFAPKKLRRGTPELVRIVVHQPKDLNAVIKAAKKLDPRTDAAPQGMPLGDVALGASIGVSLEVRGAACDGAVQRRSWQGEPIDFNFSAEADEGVKQVVFLARVFINDAQIGVLAFTRNVTGPNKKPHDGDRVRLKRHKRVFLSYSSKDRETVAAIATAYASAGVEHFWDRASLKSGEEWHPRLRREIDRADLFHVCWSKNAAESEWVKKETEHAITRRRRNSGKPDITVQMLDGPPWAKHPPELDSINFDDFVRAAIVGYARGDGSE
ncbi:MAG: toll/interleukin-1 receptor domain-containing protein [Hyphomonadaceae bacterium]|nr:toll/interleukin-1 receptor domain-containing protein [Hyphomonadaceae bacterium]